MNVIRINWPLVKRLIAFILGVIVIKLVYDRINRQDSPSVDYDPTKRAFFIQLNSYYYSNYFSNPSLAFSFDPIVNTKRYLSENSGNLFKKRFKLQIKSVKVSYNRILVENWVDILENIVRLGINTVEIEIPWGSHEGFYKKYDFNQGTNDLVTFIRLVYDYKLFLIVKIDPYIPCSVYDLGGMPSWLLGEGDLEMRETKNKGDYHGLLDLDDKKFKEIYTQYLDQLLPIIFRNQLVKDGPIIGILIGYSQDKIIQSFYDLKYVQFIRSQLKKYNIVERLFISKSTCEYDRIKSDNYKDFCDSNLDIYSIFDDKATNSLENPSIRNINQKTSCSEESKSIYWNSNSFNYLRRNLSSINKEKFEFERFKHNLVGLLRTNKSFSINNFYCATNFGFSVGAHHDLSTNAFLAISTSFENDKCHVKEDMTLSNKYWLTYEILYNHYKNDDESLAPLSFIHNTKTGSRSLTTFTDSLKIPKNIIENHPDSMIELKMSHFLPYDKIISNLHSPIALKPNLKELFMEYLNLHYTQDAFSNHGYILYRLSVNLPARSHLYIKPNSIKDHAIIICDYSNVIYVVDHLNDIKNKDNHVSIRLRHECKDLSVLVEQMGRLSDVTDRKKFSQQRKGFLARDAISFKSIKRNTIEIGGMDWKINFLDFSPKFYNRFSFNSNWLSIEKYSKNSTTPFMAFARFNVNKIQNSDSKNSGKSNIYLLMKNWHKGVVLINGFNLGKYWDVGPFISLFVPNHILNDGPNELVLFEMYPVKNPTIYFVYNHIRL